jgi:hypothetical protein
MKLRFAFAIGLLLTLALLSPLDQRDAVAYAPADISGNRAASASVRQEDHLQGQGRSWPASVVVTSTAELFLPLVTKAQTGGAPVIQSFSANPATIVPGAASTLSWSVAGATSLSIAPGVGTVSGSSVVVQPGATTRYTLLATNAAGSTSAQVDVAVVNLPPATPDGFFVAPIPDIELPTAHPTVKVDPAGGVHIVFVPQSAVQGSPARPAYYAYCAANCTNAASFTIVHLGDGVDLATLALDPAGHPRLLLRVPAQSGAVFVFQYWACDSNCLVRSQWSSGNIGFAYARQVGWVEPFIRSFAVDHLGRPRFVYYDAGADSEDPHWGAFYAYCNAGCTAAANWYEVRLLADSQARDFALAFSPTGQPRLAYATYNRDTLAQPVGYAECNQECQVAANWSGILLADTASASVSHFAAFALGVDSHGRPRLALYTGTGLGGSLAPNTLYYLACNATNCAQSQAWSSLNLNFPQTQGEEGVALTLDAQDRPRIAYHAPVAAGFGLNYAWCDGNCDSSAQGWRYEEIEASEEVNQELPIPPAPGCSFPQCNPPVPPCTISTWDTGVRPSLALDSAGNPRIAYDADHGQGGGCGTYTDTKQTRFVSVNQP